MSETGSQLPSEDQTTPESPFGAPNGLTAPSPGSPAAQLHEHLSPDAIEAPGHEGHDNDAQQEVESPAKIIRIGAMVKQLLEEVRNSGVDDPAREQLGRVYANAIAELKTALSPELGDELDNLSFLFEEDSSPSEAELRLAQAQLVGWLEGLFHGIQATLMAQQMTARQQLEGMRAQAQLPDRSSGTGPGTGYL